jgi:(p)ppGpp synthase/HD superfamily hydrolase
MKNFFIYWSYFIYYYIEILIDINTSDDTNEANQIAHARMYALMTHHKVRQRYDGKYPYYYHLKMVSNFAILFSHLLTTEQRVNAIIIALLHDFIEDCRLTYNDVKEIWGVEIADGVYACTELRGKNHKERHGPEYIKGLQESYLGTYVKLCDITANMTMGQRTGSKMFPMYQKEYSHTKKQLYKEEFKEIFEYMETNLVNC